MRKYLNQNYATEIVKNTVEWMQSIIITKDTIDKKANGTTESSLSANSLVERSHTTKRYANSFTNTIALIIVGAILISGCSRKRYVPVVKYPYPSYSALNKTLRGVYGDRYSYAGQGPNRFDCSGLTYFSYATMNKWLPRRAIDQARVGKTVQLNELQYGDLIFFDTHPNKSYSNYSKQYLTWILLCKFFNIKKIHNDGADSHIQ